jgi:hypothetical protein
MPALGRAQICYFLFVFQMNGVDVTSLTHMQIVTLATSSRELCLLIKPIEQPQQQGLYGMVPAIINSQLQI